MNFLRSVVLCAAGMTISGCAALFEFTEDQVSVDALTLRKDDIAKEDRNNRVGTKEQDRRAVNLDNYRLRVPAPQNGAIINGVKVYKHYDVTIDNATFPEAIKAWGYFLLQRSDEQCDEHKAGVVANRSTVNGLFSAAATAVGTAGALVSGATAARILSGSAGGLTGLRSTYNETFFQNLLATTIVKEITKLRKLEQSKIYEAIRKDEYGGDGSAARLLYDINRYHQLCSFYVGLVSLTDDAARVKPVAQNLKAQVKVTEEAIKRYSEELPEVQKLLSDGDADVKAQAKRRYILLSRSREEAEIRLKSLQTQLSLAEVVTGEGPGLPKQGKNEQEQSPDPDGDGGHAF